MMCVPPGSVDFSTSLDPDLAIACPGLLCDQPSWPSSSLLACGQHCMGACDTLTLQHETPGKGFHPTFSHLCCCMVWPGRAGGRSAGERHQDCAHPALHLLRPADWEVPREDRFGKQWCVLLRRLSIAVHQVRVESQGQDIPENTPHLWVVAKTHGCKNKPLVKA